MSSHSVRGLRPQLTNNNTEYVKQTNQSQTSIATQCVRICKGHLNIVLEYGCRSFCDHLWNFSSYLQYSFVFFLQLLKPHSKPLVQITINEQRTLLVTCGQDSTIFMYRLEKGTPFVLHRLGFIETPNNIAFMTWKPEEVIISSNVY